MLSKLYTKLLLNAVRTMSAIGILFLLSSLCFYSDSIFYISQVLLVILFLIILIIFPQKFTLFSFTTLHVALSLLITQPGNLLYIPLLLISYYTLKIRGFFYKHKSIKIVIFAIIIVSAFLSEIRFGKSVFFDTVLKTIPYAFFTLTGLFFIKIYYINTTVNKSTRNKELDIAIYSNTRETDATMLNMVLQNIPYKTIAIELKMSEGGVRNRLNKLYDKLLVADRIGFVTTYSGFTICFGKTEANE